MPINSDLKHFAAALAENVINTSDKEIIKEFIEDHGDPEYEANIMRGIIDKVKQEAHDDD